MEKLAKNICLSYQLKLFLLRNVEGESEQERERFDVLYYCLSEFVTVCVVYF